LTIKYQKIFQIKRQKLIANKKNMTEWKTSSQESVESIDSGKVLCANLHESYEILSTREDHIRKTNDRLISLNKVRFFNFKKIFVDFCRCLKARQTSDRPTANCIVGAVICGRSTKDMIQIYSRV
jgi:hypothetical protein